MTINEDLGLTDTSSAHAIDKESCNRADLGADSFVTEPVWIGIETTQRRLFSSCQSGWFKPITQEGSHLAIRSFMKELNLGNDKSLSLRLSFYIENLPLPISDEINYKGFHEKNTEKADGLVVTVPSLPLYALRSIEVDSIEHESNLVSLAQNFSNVSLPTDKILVSEFDNSVQGFEINDNTRFPTWQLPSIFNSVHGAIAMAIWAIPRVQPWIQILRLALNHESVKTENAVRQIGVPWLKIPWLRGPLDYVTKSEIHGNDTIIGHTRGESVIVTNKKLDTNASVRTTEDLSLEIDKDVDSLEVQLWYAALASMRADKQNSKNSKTIAEQIATHANKNKERISGVDSWYTETLSLLEAKTTIRCDPMDHHSVGLAIQLVLLRPDPNDFKTWLKNHPNLPPAVWWAASILCGWHHGYESLDNSFRGVLGLRDFTSIRALVSTSNLDEKNLLPEDHRVPLTTDVLNNEFIFFWSGAEIIRKSWTHRAKWYATQLRGVKVNDAALNLVRRLSWPCIDTWITLPTGSVRTEGSGDIFVEDDAIVVANGTRKLLLSEAIEPEGHLNEIRFRNYLAIGAGFVNEPPSATNVEFIDEVPGLIYKRNFLSPEDEDNLLNLIDKENWDTGLRRRVQHYGWKYDYKQRSIDESMRMGRLPKWAQQLAQKLVTEGFMSYIPDQVIVNEYVGKQGISKHCDQPRIFDDEVATVSLLETWDMVFRNKKDGRKVVVPLERGSVAILTDDARFKWTHEIPNRAHEKSLDNNGKYQIVPRVRRVSLTFRKTRIASRSS